MKIYTIFDDFDAEAIDVIRTAGGDLTVHPSGTSRPDSVKMKEILNGYDCVIIGTSQKITEDMFEEITTPRLIATASVGLDHIWIPNDKKHLVTVINTPKANAQSVAEYTIGCMLNCCKRLEEGKLLYKQKKNNKQLSEKPEDLCGKTLGVAGAGNVSVRIMEYARFFGMNVICWTRNPDRHRDLKGMGVSFVSLEELAGNADVISVNLPNNADTKSLISKTIIQRMKDTSIFISVSRMNTVDAYALIEKAKACRSFYVCLDIDVDEELADAIPDQPNVCVTPHIAGGTKETRKRMFRELAEQIAERIREN